MTELLAKLFTEVYILIMVACLISSTCCFLYLRVLKTKYIIVF